MSKQQAPIDMPEVMDPRFVEGTVVEFTDVEGRYFHVVRPDTGVPGVFTKNPEWSVQVRVSADAARAMKKVGFTVEEDTGNGTFWIKAKSVVTQRTGKAGIQPKMTKDGADLQSDPADGSTIKSIKMWCKYTDPIRGKVYMGCYLNSIEMDNVIERVSSAPTVKF